MFNGLNVTISCEATGSGPIRYQWRRVNGEISSDRAEGVNTSTLTISPVQQEDEDEYYCVASNGGMDALHYSDISHRAMVTIYGNRASINYKCYRAQYECSYLCYYMTSCLLVQITLSIFICLAGLRNKSD